MKKKSPSISVVIITKETPFMILKRCIHCIRSQTLKDIEIILLDANEKGNAYQQAISSEGELLKDIIYVYYPEDGDMVHGKNLALEKATSDYITFISARDYMPENRLKTVLEAFANNPSHCVFYTAMTAQINTALENYDFTLPVANYKYLAQAVFHRSTFQMVGKFDEQMHCLWDEEFWLRVRFCDLAGFISDDNASISIYEDAYRQYQPLNAAIAHRQMLVKFPNYFKKNKSIKRSVYHITAQNYKEAHVFSRYLQFRWKELCCK